MTADPIDLLFGGMTKLGPGSDASTEHVLGLIPRRTFAVVVDAGCGAGRQSITLARELRTTVHAVDTYQGFLDTLTIRADDAGVGQLVRPHRMDMADIPSSFSGVDLLWSEAAAYSIGLEHALGLWRETLSADGYLVFSELCWITAAAHQESRRFFGSAYPDMRTVADVAAVAERQGYRVVTTYTVPRSDWWDGYYEVLQPRAMRLRDHADAAVRALAAEMLVEIDVFQRFPDDYGYVFFVLRRGE